MQTARESICCREVENSRHKCDEIASDKVSCVTEHEEFQTACRARFILRLSLVHMHDVHPGDLREPLSNRVLRLAGYRNFTYWVHKRIGRRVRRVIPACVIASIRSTYPEESGVYVGFKEGSESEVEEAWLPH
ncbi:PREDICTED: uncharacterized protein LOC106810659 [Priapulus caudatus]|uniref:Uncharacterized protein LOC106810659 n=1 Tax=Priapulus caudatus TaxID=37621 RepID=A0ABM1EBK9_PRICU|nr:PREDICTED: uncharacterized protein LOC106810659 [Priapulus caudatus]